jgi:hypothetical protein
MYWSHMDQAVHNWLALAGGTEKSSQNISNQLPTYTKLTSQNSKGLIYSTADGLYKES